MEMSKERLVAFTDAVIAIIMTILVLELERPTHITWEALWELRMNFFAYAISFFWIGTMWVNMHRAWDQIETVNNRVVWISIILLFFTSFFPYTTSLVAADFNNAVGQTCYGIIALIVSFVNVWMYRELGRQTAEEDVREVVHSHNIWMRLDIAIKVAGLVLTLTLLPSAMMWAVLITALFIVLPRSIS